MQVHDASDLFSDILRRQNEIDAPTGNGAPRHFGLQGRTQFLRDRDATHVPDAAKCLRTIPIVAGDDHGEQLPAPVLRQ